MIPKNGKRQLDMGITLMMSTFTIKSSVKSAHLLKKEETCFLARNLRLLKMTRQG